MSTPETILAALNGVLLVTLLVVLAFTGSYRYSYVFTVYVAVQTGTFIYIAAHLEHVLNDWPFWATKELVYAVLRIAVIGEIVLLIFRVLPRARARAQLIILVAIAALGVGLYRTHDTNTAGALARDLTQTFSYVTVWSLIAILGLVAWHRVPLLRFHKMVLHGLLWLLLAHFSTVFGMHRFGSEPMGLIYNSFQLLVLVAWIVAALRDDRVGLGKDERAVIRYLQPWRES